MKNSFKIIGMLIFVLGLFASYSWTVEANPSLQGSIPPIPHPIEGREPCALCHATGVGGAPKFPADHTGRTNEMCQLCHKPGATPPATGRATPATQPTTGAPVAKPTTAGNAPRIPHPLQNRENCLACHQAGVGGATKIPASHAGRADETCRGCHQSITAEVPVIVPTPIPHVPPVVPNRDDCVACHTAQAGKLNEPVKEWQTSVHAERGVACVDCHGGDATQNLKENAHAVKANYVGKPNLVDIPALCASCHARVEMMRQYDLPTDQWAKYQQSIHGIRLAQADFKVATCFTCHDGHGTKKVNDPTARVYPLNVPALCASCHANAEYMKGYNMPTNQHALYVISVHGKALLEKQDLRAPSCATCHGTHGAAPPGFDEVANVCGSCHTATQEYYLKSQHASNKPGAPKCVSCHGRYDVMSPSEAMFTGTDTRACGSCHAANSPQAQAARELHTNLTASAQAIEEAEKAIRRAASSALIVAPEEVKLAQARTELITARAAQHTLDLTVIKERTAKATAQATEVINDAERSISGSLFRRQFMLLGLGIMALAIASLWIVRRELYKQLPPE